MTTMRQPLEEHPFLRCLASVDAALDDVAGLDPTYIPTGDKTRALRAVDRELGIRDRTCPAEGCDIQSAWCEAHHAGQPWADGGRTDLADGVILRPFHHHRAHDPTWDPSRLPNGDVRYVRRT
jgi:hypothetical protein